MLALVGVDLRKGDAAVVIHGHEDVLPADVARTLGAVAGDAVADLVEAAELLDVDVQQFAGAVALVALHRLARAQIAQPGQARSPEHTADRGFGHAHVRGDVRLQAQLAAQLHDAQRYMRLDGSRRLLGS